MDDRIVPLLQQAETLKNELDSLRPLDKEREAIVLQKLRLDWNFHSNHLEGNSLTFGETKALILFGITAQGKPLQDHIEITGHDEAIKWIEDVVHKKEPLTEYFIRQLHTLLLKETYPVDAITPDGQPTKKQIKVGEYKTTPNHVKTKTGEIFRFATPEETPAKMNDLLEWYRTEGEKKEVNPILFAADFHYKFIRIHPFDDGNGRMARMLMNFILMQYGYPPVIIKTGEKVQYIAALEQADAGIFEPFIEFIINNETHSLEIMLKGARGESIEEPDDLDKEIALLKQKIKSKGKEIKSFRTKETISLLFKENFSKLVQQFFNEIPKSFADLFQKTEKILLINGTGIPGDSLEELIANAFQYIENNSNIYKFNMVTRFITFIYVDVISNNEFILPSNILIDCDQETTYSISSASNLSFRKFYGERLTDEERLSLINSEKLHIKQQIEDLLPS
jgi:Fic family protein